MSLVDRNGKLTHKPNDLVSRKEAEMIAVKVAEHYFEQCPDVVVQVLAKLGIIQQTTAPEPDETVQ
jgi:hypothetical protein